MIIHAAITRYINSQAQPFVNIIAIKHVNVSRAAAACTHNFAHVKQLHQLCKRSVVIFALTPGCRRYRTFIGLRLATPRLLCQFLKKSASVSSFLVLKTTPGMSEVAKHGAKASRQDTPVFICFMISHSPRTKNTLSSGQERLFKVHADMPSVKLTHHVCMRLSRRCSFLEISKTGKSQWRRASKAGSFRVTGATQWK